MLPFPVQKHVEEGVYYQVPSVHSVAFKLGEHSAHVRRLNNVGDINTEPSLRCERTLAPLF